MLNNGTQHPFHPPGLYHRLCARHKLEARDTAVTEQAGPRPPRGSSPVGRPVSEQSNGDCSPGFRQALGTLFVHPPPHITDNSWSPGSGSPLVLTPSTEQGLVSICPGKRGNSLTQRQKSLCGYVPLGSYQPSQVWLPGLYSKVRATSPPIRRQAQDPDVDLLQMLKNSVEVVD